jgi:enoyl-CoA hydratase
MTNLVLRRDQDGCATLTLNRPDKLNALNIPLFQELRAHVDALAQEKDKIGLVVLRGAGKCFSAGHDMKDLAAGEKTPKSHYQAETIETLATLPQPVITAVHGHCYTGALELALAGDLIIAAQSAKFADTHGKWALTPVWGLSQRLPRRVGTAKALEMMLTCRPYTGEEAAAMGLANMCVPDDQFDAEIDKFARTILANAWFSNFANKKLILDTDGMSLAAGLAHEVYRTEGRGQEMQARMAAFLKKD